MTNLFADVMYRSFPHYKDNLGRVTLKTNIVLMDNPEKCDAIGIVKIGELDFWNDISGWFHSNANSHKVYRFNNASVEIPDDVDVTEFSRIGGFVDGFTIGSVVVDQDYNVYVVHSFHRSSGSDIYFNYINPNASDYLTALS